MSYLSLFDHALKTFNVPVIKDDFKFEIEIPGFSKEEINLELSPGYLYVSAKSESRNKNFSCYYSIPSKLNIETAKARLENGILYIEFEPPGRATTRALQIA